MGVLKMTSSDILGMVLIIAGIGGFVWLKQFRE